MSGTLRTGLVAAAALVAVGCAATTFNSTWRAPEAKPESFKGKKVAALCITKDESVRYGAEDALARELTARGAVGISAYSLIPKELIQDKDKAKEFLQKANVAGIVSMRVAGKEKEINSTPGGMYAAPYYGSYWAGGGYYGWAWGGAYSPSYVTTDTIVYVETLIYSMAQDKLVWAGRSETTNPEKVGPFVKELAAKVAAEVKKEGLVKN